MAALVDELRRFGTATARGYEPAVGTEVALLLWLLLLVALGVLGFYAWSSVGVALKRASDVEAARWALIVQSGALSSLTPFDGESERAKQAANRIDDPPLQPWTVL
jgi:hypothetical protein